jgi:ribonuclease Z
MRVAGRVSYPLELVELEPGQVLDRDGYSIATVAVAHRIRAFGYVLYEDERPGEFDPRAAIELGLTEGPEFGLVQHGTTVRGVTSEQVLGPPRRGRKLVISGDTAPSDAIRVAAYEADLLIHEATFAEEELQRAIETQHSTAAQAASVARDASVTMLALTHVSSRYPPAVLRDEASAVFDATVLPRDFDTIEIPLPERGAPQLIRWRDQQQPPASPQPELAAEAVTDPAG